MPLLLLDLDNTLLDREGAFHRWAVRFAAKHADGSTDEVSWLENADADGYEPRGRFLERVAERFQLGTADRAALQEDLRWGMADDMKLDPTVAAALGDASMAGWSLVVVTNGTVEQQERKLAGTGLDRLVDAWVISEAAGCKKPDARIFEVAAESVSGVLAEAWVIGDSGTADIGGAERLGLDSVWIRRGRSWSEKTFTPTLEADSCADAIALALDR